MDDSLQPHGLHSPWNSPGQNTGVGSFPLLQRIFPTQGSNPGLPHCRRFFTSWDTREAQESWRGWQNIVPNTVSFYTTIFTKVYFFSTQKISGRVKFFLFPTAVLVATSFSWWTIFFSVVVRISQIYVDASLTPCSLKFFPSSHPVISISSSFSHWQNPIPQLNQ